MGNSEAYAALDSMLEKLRAVPGLAKEAAPDVATELRNQIAGNIAAQRDPYGKPEDGESNGTGDLP
jgi:hypothetical protein